ncbi:hypothetical protein S7711_11610 [Stachybotrys chartarum IBT 7711]|uniref:Uncharacterized protein n=1 Tax=Stachybotrys chartarum (strain CBS 109288 / IBT 7711) TaxID=1280523 RepID=A0A084B8R7_STACB|nr:hypothetical protein S7711_11610 [Stachybotrys chartarum IBT 7711]
MTRLMKKP